MFGGDVAHKFRHPLGRTTRGAALPVRRKMDVCEREGRALRRLDAHSLDDPINQATLACLRPTVDAVWRAHLILPSWRSRAGPCERPAAEYRAAILRVTATRPILVGQPKVFGHLPSNGFILHLLKAKHVRPQLPVHV
jgi:hypothetical protein